MTDARPTTVLRTIAFIDLARFTALTDAHGDDEAARWQQSFVQQLREQLGDAVECVKHLGDGAMLAAEEDAPLLTCLRALAAAWSGDPHAPLLRVGVHRGPVVVLDTEHGRDYLGRTVNIAARLCEIAAGGQLVHSGAVGSDGHATSRGEQRLRGVHSPVEVFVRELVDTNADIDPVCGMPVPSGTGAGALVHDAATYRFCSLPCARRFAEDPSAFSG